MAKITVDSWKADFFEQSPLFDAIRNVALPFVELRQWPRLEQFSAELHKKNICSHGNRPVQAVAQSGKPEKFDDLYESRIYLKGELQTRLQNWHDFFNAMCWLQFPKIKAALNALHFQYSETRVVGTNRSPVENAITLFDECGAIIVADDATLLDLIRNHEWRELFVANREKFGKHIQCYVFGHAMFEKAITPYIGMTAHSILLQQGSHYFQQDYSQQLDEIDGLVSGLWLNHEIENTKALQPFPLLGMPGWWAGEQGEDFYSNEIYFRKKGKAE